MRKDYWFIRSTSDKSGNVLVLFQTGNYQYEICGVRDGSHPTIATIDGSIEDANNILESLVALQPGFGAIRKLMTA